MKKPYVCAIMSMKGGVGKTSVTMGLAGAMAQYLSKKVLVVDTDQSINSTNYYRQMIGQRELMTNTIKDCLRDENPLPLDKCIRIFDCYRTRGLASDEKEHFFTSTNGVTEDNPYPRTREAITSLLPGDKDIGEMELDDVMALSKLLHTNPATEYDYALIDCPPEVLSTAVQALFAADGIIIVLEPGSDSVEGLQDLLGNVREVQQAGHRLRILGIVMNKYASNEWASQYYHETLKEQLPDFVFETVIPRSSSAEKARSLGIFPTVFERLSPYSKAYVSLAIEMDNRAKGGK